MTDQTSHESYIVELLGALLVEQRRSATFLAILTYVTVILLTLGVIGGIIGGVLASQS